MSHQKAGVKKSGRKKTTPLSFLFSAGEENGQCAHWEAEKLDSRFWKPEEGAQVKAFPMEWGFWGSLERGTVGSQR